MTAVWVQYSLYTINNVEAVLKFLVSLAPAVKFVRVTLV